MLRKSALLLTPLALAACLGGGLDPQTKASAQRATLPIVADQLPAVPIDIGTTCIVDNASPLEAGTLASAAEFGSSQDTINTVTAIARRPATQKCIADAQNPRF